jgi:hypothetical protein
MNISSAPSLTIALGVAALGGAASARAPRPPVAVDPASKATLPAGGGRLDRTLGNRGKVTTGLRPDKQSFAQALAVERSRHESAAG